MAITGFELKWLHYLLQDLQVPISGPILLFCDNQTALCITSNLVYHECSKHIEIDCHFVHHEFHANHIFSTYLSTDAQLADIFTKALGASQFHNSLGKLDICNLHAPYLRGSIEIYSNLSRIRNILLYSY